MLNSDQEKIDRAREAAIEVLLHNMRGPFGGLPRVAGWGYPEPYTRDLMICSLGMLACGDKRLADSLRKVLEACAKNQSRLGHIPSLAHDPEDRGSSDTTPLFLMAVGLYRKAMKQPRFLDRAVERALTWMRYQSPSDRAAVAQLPTSDWRDEQWVLGYGLFVNAVLYACLELLGRHGRASRLREAMSRFTIKGGARPHYALWRYKVYKDERFDLLGNSLAILSGIASRSRARAIVAWVEAECLSSRRRGELALDLPPNLFPYILPGDPDWRPRYRRFNKPGEYHNGGVWPFVCGFYVAALVAAGRRRLAEEKLVALTGLVLRARRKGLAFGFNEWLRAQDGAVRGQDWQSWSAAMYLYAAECVRRNRTPFFDEIRARA
ncbi:MAG: glycoside hydrolase 100 family protein [Elusimicrobiota bacterium]